MREVVYDGVTKKKSVEIVHLDWNRECKMDMVTGKGFWITDPAIDNKTQKKNENGIKSTKFCSDWEDEHAFQERYTCECKHLKGKAYEGELCPRCNKSVSYRDVDYKMFGWVNLYGFQVIHPSLYILLRSLIGKQNLEDIMTFDTEFNLEGQDIGIQADSKNPFKGKGVTWFKNNYRKVLKFFLKKKKAKQDVYDYLIENEEKIFVNAIPVYNSILRPEEIKYETFYYFTINRVYTTLFNISQDLKTYEGLRRKRVTSNEYYDIEEKLTRIQSLVNTLYEKVFDVIARKEGFIKQDILGGRVSFSARNLIIPDSSLNANEIALPYLTFVKLYSFELIGYLSEISGIDETSATNIIHKASITFNPEVYELCNFMLKRGNVKCIINRNPTIAYGSMLTMDVVRIKEDFYDLTMSLPISILSMLNADFDGDVLNIVSLKSERLKKVFSKFLDPKVNMFISRNDGLYNSKVDLLKDESIGLFDFANI